MNSRKKATLEQYLEVGTMIRTGELDRHTIQLIIERRLATPSTASIRETQAKRLYDLKFGDVLGVKTFEAYLDGTDAIEAVPQIPNFSEAQVRIFGREGVWLIDGRVAEKVGLTEYLHLVGLAYGGNDDAFEAHDPKRAKSGIRWMIGQDGYRNKGKKADDCRKAFQPPEVGMDCVEGGGVYGINPKVIDGPHYMDLPNSVPRENRDDCACLGVLDGKPEIYGRWNDDESPRCGSASRGE